ncbi:MAG: rhodanese-like domain-containing protein [Pseudomonadales bacterium]
MALDLGYKALLEAAEKEIRTLTTEEARQMLDRDDVQFVDIRDVRELEREGRIPGAFHATRGMLEFWIDPESPYFKDVFAADKTFVFYCQSGWRSALATQTVQRMGLPKVCHIGGGYRAWKDSGAPTEALPPRG